jgi:tetratricopeptide (TPR) repeat protein
MTAEQLKKIPELFAQALEQEPAARESFLRQACADDAQLFRAVTTLLASSDEAESFLEAPAFREAAQILAADSEASDYRLSNSTLGRYQIIAPVGRGGMGEVYRARDDLDREVAIKILPDHFAQNPERVARFEREARTLARLSHPNIAVIYGREQSAAVRFLVMEFVQGETLSERLRQGPLPISEALMIFSQIADALAATHEADIIHRDLKPANIMLTPKGQVKLLDFGIARHFRRDAALTENITAHHESGSESGALTHPGFTPGTVAYMSPEQCAGRERGSHADHDARAIDLWAFGLVLYESLTGHHPFREPSSDQTRTAIREREPDFQKLPKETPPAIHKLLRQCLEKNPQRRLRDAAEARRLIADAARPSLLSWMKTRFRSATKPVRLALVVAALALVLSAAWLIWKIPLQRGAGQTIRLAVIAADSDNQQSCDQSRSKTVAAWLQDRLKEIRGLRIINTEVTSDRTLPLMKADLSREQIARTFGADVALKITAGCNSSQRSFSYSLISRQGEELASGSETDFRQVMISVTGALRVRADRSLIQSADHEQRYYQALVLLDQYANEESVNQAISILKELNQTDSGNRARVNAALGQASYLKYVLTGRADFISHATAYCDQVAGSQLPEALLKCASVLKEIGHVEQAITDFELVLKQRPDDAEALLGLARAYERKPDPQKAEQLYQQAISLRPDYWAGYNELGAFYFDQGRTEEAARQWLRVTELLPFNPYGFSNLGSALLYQGKFSEAIFHLQQSIRQKPTATAALNLGIAFLYQGSCAEAIAAFEEGAKSDAEDPEFQGWLGDALRCDSQRRNEAAAAYTRAIRLVREKLKADPQNVVTQALLAEWLAKSGENEQAIAQIQKTMAVADGEPFSTITAIKVFWLTGRKAAALQLLPQAARDRNNLFDLEHAPELSGLRADPAYQRIVEPLKKSQEKQ